MAVKEKIDRKSQIMEVAERLFSEKGYLATSMRDIADVLNIEAASLYSHIKSKDDLLWAIAMRCADDFFAETEPAFKAQVHVRKKLRDMIVAHIKVITRNQKAAAVFFREWRHLESPKKEEYDALREKYEDMFRNVIQEGIKENLFLNFDNRFTSRAVLSALNWTHTWYRADGDMLPNEIGEKLADLLMDGLIRKV